MGVYIGDYNTDSWNLNFLGYTIDSPEPKLNVVSIPLRDGVIDITETFGGPVRYENRAILMRFELRDERGQWASKLSTIRSAIHGQMLDVKLPDDTSHYWHGRVSVSGFTDNISTATIEITVDANPFKHESVVTELEPITVSGSSATVTLNVTTDRMFLGFICSGTISVSFLTDVFHINDQYTMVTGIYADNNIAHIIAIDGTEYALNSVVSMIPGLVLSKGTNTLEIQGTGTVTIVTVGGSL